MLDYILEFDRELLIYLNNLGQEPWDGFWFAVTNKWSSIPLYVLLLFLMAKGLGKKGVVLLVLCLAAMITFTDQVTNLFKDGFERLRPCAQEGVVEFLRLGDCHGFGFFSGHSSNSMAAAVFTILIFTCSISFNAIFKVCNGDPNGPSKLAPSATKYIPIM